MSAARPLALLLICVAVFTGCSVEVDRLGGSSDDDPSASTTASTETAVPESESPSALPPEISIATACDMLFPDGRHDSPMQAAVEWVSGDESISTDQADAIQSDVDEIKDIAEQTPDPLKTHLVVWSDIVQGLLDDALGGESGGSWDSTNFKASGLEIANTCGG